MVDSTPSNELLAHKILSRCYASRFSLPEYLTLVTQDAQLYKDDDTPAYLTLLDACVVATQTTSPLAKFKIYPPMSSQGDIIDRVHSKLFAQSNRPNNVLAFGYRPADHYNESGAANMFGSAVANFYINANVTLLQSAEWETLLSRIGELTMIHLLLNTSLFLPVGNDCLYQISGRPIYELTNNNDSNPVDAGVIRDAAKRKADDDVLSSRAIKRGKVAIEDPARLIAKVQRRQLRSTNNVAFIRQRVLFAQPNRRSSDRIAIGIPIQNALNWTPDNKTVPSTETPSQQDNPLERTQGQIARHVSKHIFPREYGLQNIFDMTADHFTSSSYYEYLAREEEIKAFGDCKTPKRLKRVLGLVTHLIERHNKCAYRKICNRTCASKIKTDALNNVVNSTAILEIMSDVSQHHVSLEVSHPSLVVPHGASAAQRASKTKPRFPEFACTHNEVYRYVVAVVCTVIPTAFWGSSENLNTVLKHVKAMIACRRFETLTLHQVTQEFRTADCEWLAPERPAYQVQRSSLSDTLKRRELLNEFIYWFFQSFLTQLLRGSFYATESSTFRNQILYFRHDDWDALCKPLLEHLTNVTFRRLEISKEDKTSVMKVRKLGYARVRLLPKDAGVRPIVNLRRRAAKGQSINQILHAAFQILTFEKNKQPDLMGAATLGASEVYAKLKDFKLRLQETYTTMPKLYFVKVDVKACFDTIDQDKLLGILQQIISKDNYVIQRYAHVQPQAGKTKRTFVKRAHRDTEHPHFLSQAAKLAASLRSAVLVDQVVYPFAGREEILELLKEHVKENVVQIGSELYQQTVGIPQGSVLSTLLCSFFYGDLEQNLLRFTKDPGNALFRFVDDYLYVTTCVESANLFLDVMNSGHPEYGCFISKDKTLTNFDCFKHWPNRVAEGQNDFPWCGWLIDTKSLEVMADYTRYRDLSLADTLTVEKSRQPGAVFMNKVLQLTKQKNHLIYTDTTLNSIRVAHINIYQNFALSAMKMYSYMKCLRLAPCVRHKFILRTVHKALRYTFGSIRNQTTSKFAADHGAECGIQRNTIIWLGMHAFHRVLSLKPTSYMKIIDSLAFDLATPKFRRLRRGLIAHAREAAKGMECINF